VSARRRGSVWDQLLVGATLLGVSAPTFLLGLVLQYLLAYRLGWLPYDGYGLTASDHLRSLVLPALTLGIFGAALYARLIREEMSSMLGADFVRTARAKGASELRVLVVHVLRNALVPIVTLLVLDLGTLLGGAVVTERLFRWPGMGQMAIDALVNRDGPVVFGTVLFSALAIVLASLLLDLVHVLLDPRLRRSTHDTVEGRR
jgi:peptide/nickel transport system permease protein